MALCRLQNEAGYENHPVSAVPCSVPANIRSPCFNFCTGQNINGLAVCSPLYAGRKFRTYATFWLSLLLSAVRIVMVPMSFFEVSLLINPFPLIRNNNEQSPRIRYQTGESYLPWVGTKSARSPPALRRLVQEGNRVHFSLTGPADSTVLFNDDNALRPDLAFPLILKQLELMSPAGELSLPGKGSTASRYITMDPWLAKLIHSPPVAVSILYLSPDQPGTPLTLRLSLKLRANIMQTLSSHRQGRLQLWPVTRWNLGKWLLTPSVMSQHYGLTLNDTPFSNKKPPYVKIIDAGVSLSDGWTFWSKNTNWFESTERIFIGKN